MARKKQVTPESVAQAISESDKPFATTTDIAEGIGVTAQSIRENSNDIVKHNFIKKDKVGQNSVYWLAEGTEINNDENAEKRKLWSKSEIRRLIQEEQNE